MSQQKRLAELADTIGGLKADNQLMKEKEAIAAVNMKRVKEAIIPSLKSLLHNIPSLLH